MFEKRCIDISSSKREYSKKTLRQVETLLKTIR